MKRGNQNTPHNNQIHHNAPSNSNLNSNSSNSMNVNHSGNSSGNSAGYNASNSHYHSHNNNSGGMYGSGQNDGNKGGYINNKDMTCKKFEHAKLPVPNLNSRLGPPGFFLHKGSSQLEEQMTILTVSNGYQEPLEVKVKIINSSHKKQKFNCILLQDQYGSVLGTMGNKNYPLKQLESTLESTLNQIAWLKSTKLSQVFFFYFFYFIIND